MRWKLTWHNKFKIYRKTFLSQGNLTFYSRLCWSKGDEGSWHMCKNMTWIKLSNTTSSVNSSVWVRCSSAALFRCVSVFHLFSCACAFGFHGTFCEVNVDDCQDHGCENGATCVDGVGNYTCLCPPNYAGMTATSVWGSSHLAPPFIRK